MTLLEQPRTAPLPTPADFPVTWDDPDDERGFWTIDKLHWPDPQPIVLFDLMPEGSISTAAAAYGLPLGYRARRINTYIYGQMAPLPLPPDELEAMGRRAQEKIGAAIARLGELWEGEWLPEVQRQIAFWDAFDRRGATMPELLGHLDDTVARLRQVWHVHFLVGIPFLLALSQFDELYRDLFGSDDALGAYKLLQGIDNMTVRSGQEQWKLSRAALATPVVRRVLEEVAADVLPTLERSEEGRAFLADLHAYLAVYGARGDKFATLVEPAWIEDPTPVIKNLKDFITQPDRDLAAERAAMLAERERAIAEARERLAGYPRPVVEEFESLLKAAEVAIVLSEDHGHWIDYSATYRARRVLLEFGRRFAEAGLLEQANDVVHLTLDEIRRTAVDLPAIDRRGLVAERKAEIAHFLKLQAPPALGTPPEGPAPDDPMMRAVGKFFGAPAQPSTEPGVLKGNPGSPGKVRGTARVIRSLADAARLGRGEILVAETTAPPWTPLFATAAAVVTDTGGVLSHCAVVAREYGIPAVVGVGTATAMISDGLTIEVDGDAGTIRLVD